MLILREKLSADAAGHASSAAPAASAGPAALGLTLTFDQRRRSRLRAQLDDGREVALMLPRGVVLRHGDALAGDGIVAVVTAAAEEVSTVRTDDARLLARACYHLGNRHIAVEVGDGYARYQHDHVLDHMVQELGLTVAVERVPFEPEAGAYGEGGGGHGHDHGRKVQLHVHGHGADSLAHAGGHDPGHETGHGPGPDRDDSGSGRR